MEFKDILVHLDNSRQCETRLELAIRLAREHSAYLTGLYVITHPQYAPQGEALNQRVRQAKELFLSKTAGADLATEYLCADWGVTGDSMVEIFNHYAYRKDLVIVGQTAQDRLLDDVPADLPERVVLGSGRPVLVVPYAGRFGNVGERVVVAWKAGRASARALNDAMPFLVKAKQVFVVTIKSSGDQEVDDIYGDGTLVTHLERYNIRVKEEILETGDAPVGNLLMNYAWEHGCYLLVMGVPAQTARGTAAIGPVARTFFEHMTLPVLMSH